MNVLEKSPSLGRALKGSANAAHDHGRRRSHATTPARAPHAARPPAGQSDSHRYGWAEQLPHWREPDICQAVAAGRGTAWNRNAARPCPAKQRGSRGVGRGPGSASPPDSRERTQSRTKPGCSDRLGFSCLTPLHRPARSRQPVDLAHRTPARMRSAPSPRTNRQASFCDLHPNVVG